MVAPLQLRSVRLIWRKYDSEFDSIVTVVGAGCLACGAYMFLSLLKYALRITLVWILAAIPLVMAVAGLLIRAREYQLWKMRPLDGPRQ